MPEEKLPVLRRRKIQLLNSNPAEAAKAVNLVYVSDTQPGISRIKKGKSFLYVAGDKPVKEKDELARIQSLVIPPAWENVWICLLPNGHLQATGMDALKRKQYRYHSLWNLLRNETKFQKLYDFGKALPAIRLAMEKDLSLQGLPQRKV
ncbi:MAG TPA: DNA topoisomerase IB, partial [Chitinophagaceae bacterium]|nr:DNA topoisomerase IB [Chitinophagaceae bacterium]